jgi:hypothetical protein
MEELKMDLIYFQGLSSMHSLVVIKSKHHNKKQHKKREKSRDIIN